MTTHAGLQSLDARGPVDSAGSVDLDHAGRMASVGILATAGGLMAIGAVITCSASMRLESALITWPIWESSVARQLVFVAAGLVAMVVASRIPYRWWLAGRGLLPLGLVGFGLILLGLVFVPGIGIERNGARRWIEIPGAGLTFQPSECLKLFLPMFLASWMAYRLNVRRFWRGLLPVVAVAAVCMGAIGLEDYGTAALLAGVTGCLLLVGGARWGHLFLMAFPAMGAFVYLLLSKPHRVARLMTFLNPWEDPDGKGYQVIQSMCAIANGGWWGCGLGRGFVKDFLPEARNDFVFAVICEELGILGAGAVIGLFVALLWQSRSVIRRCVDPAGRLLALALAMMIGLQATMNIAVVTACVPTKGISLPLVSAGGSGVVFLGVLVGVLASVARRMGETPEAGVSR